MASKTLSLDPSLTPSNTRRNLCNAQYVGTQLLAAFMQITRQSCQVKEGFVYRIWLGTGYALGHDLKNSPRNVPIYVEWIVKQPSEA